MENSKIAWTHHTFNGVIGCTRWSDGCVHCYTEEQDNRHLYGPESHWGPGAPRYITSDAYWAAPYKWDREAQKDKTRKRVFCASLSDWADDETPAGIHDRLWNLIRQTPHPDWLMLTKRAAKIVKYLPKDWSTGYPIVWLGVSVENHKHGFPRVDILREIPAVLRFLSCEPLLEDIGDINLDGIDWVITGGESGHKARDFDLAWARTLQMAARKYGASYFLKRLGLRPVEIDSPFRILQANGKPDRQGHTLSTFPADLQVQEFPVVKTEARAEPVQPAPVQAVPVALPVPVQPKPVQPEPVPAVPQAWPPTWPRPKPTLPDMWPEPLAEDAFIGPAGKLVGLLKPHTVADPSGILLSLLTAVGSMVGALVRNWGTDPTPL